MINSLFAIFAVCALFGRRLSQRGRVILWMSLSVLAFAQIGQKVFPGLLALLLIEQFLIWLERRFPVLNHKFFPLIYASFLLTMNAVLHLNAASFSYLVLASSLDLWSKFQGTEQTWRDRTFNLMSFAKTVVGPITGAKDLKPLPREDSEIFRLAFLGILKAFILSNLWRTYTHPLAWADLHGVQGYAWFGLWNYVNLYLEFSGTCDLVAASFWVLGFNCPLNFDRPYLALSVSQFWQRWHITLSHWIRDFVYIPFGGSRVSRWRIFVNLMLAMLLSGLWHGLSPHYLVWGGLQGVFLCFERLVGQEKRLSRANPALKFTCWMLTQVAVTFSWVIFFAKF